MWLNSSARSIKMPNMSDFFSDALIISSFCLKKDSNVLVMLRNLYGESGSIFFPAKIGSSSVDNFFKYEYWCIVR